MKPFKICFSCKNSNITVPDKTFYCIPINARKRLQWCEALSFNPNRLPKQCFVCSDHFQEDDFIYNDKGLKFLKPLAVPIKLITREIKIEDAYDSVHLNGDGKENILEYHHEDQNDLEMDQSELEVFGNTSKENNREKSKCRSCMEATDNGLPVYLSCLHSYTIKDALIQIMPELIQFMQDNDIVCRRCFKIIKDSLKFVVNCLRVNQLPLILENIQEKQKPSVDQKEIGEIEIIETENSPSKTGNDGKCKMNFGSIENDLTVVSLQNGVEGPAKTEKLTKVFNDMGITVDNQSQLPGRKRILLIGKEDVWRCPICDKDFVTEAVRQMHFASNHKLSKAHLLTPRRYYYHNKEATECAVCNMKFDNATMLEAHAKKCNVFCCPYCNIFVSADGLAKHTREEHNDARPFKCFSCYKQFSNFKVYQKHHILKKKVQDRYDGFWKHCKICHERVACFEYKEHFNSHKIHSCEFCKRKFTNAKSLNNHQEEHSETTSLCPFCGKIFSLIEINNHIKSSHANVKSRNVSCDECCQRFRTEANLQQHIKTVHNCVPVECKLCYQKFDGTRALKCHLSWKHNESNKNVCFLCMTKFSSASSLNRHIMRTHAGLDLNMIPYKCKHCDKQYFVKGDLTRHEKTHNIEENTVESKFKCPLCDKSYKRTKTLLWHVEEKHNGTIINVSKDTNKSQQGDSSAEEVLSDSGDIEEHHVISVTDTESSMEDEDIL